MSAPLRIQVPAQSQVANNQEDKIGRDDRSALVCCHEPSYLEYLTGQLRGIGYKVHHASGHQPAVQRLGGRSYHLTVLLENLEGCALVDNGLWQHLCAMPTDERRQTYVVMLCQSFESGDEMYAYALGVDQLINYQDIGSFAQLVVPPVEEFNEGNRHFTAALRKAA